MRHVNRHAVGGKVAVFHIGQRHGGAFVAAGAIAQSFIGSKIKQFAGDYFAAGRRSKLIALERRFWASRDARVDIREEILRVQRAVSQKVVDRSMELVRAAFGDRVDLRGTPAVFRGIGIRLNLEFLNFIDGGNGCYGVEVWRGIGRAIQKEIRVLSARSAYRILVSHTTADIAN